MHDRVDRAAPGADRPLAHALMHDAEHGLVAELVIPAQKLVAAEQAVHEILGLFRERGRSDDAEVERGRAQPVRIAAVVGYPRDQQAGIRAIERIGLTERRLVGREHALADRERHVVFGKTARLQPGEPPIQCAEPSRQRGVVEALDGR